MLWGGREVLLLHPRTPAWEPGLSRGARGCSVLSDRGGPAASPHADSAGPASEHKALVFTVAAHSGLFTRLIWNNKPVPTLLAPASLHPRPVFEDVFKFRAYTQQTPGASSWRASTGEGGDTGMLGSSWWLGLHTRSSRGSKAALASTQCLLFHVRALS